jgi:DNA (cytosine-5)-methyltransferase 1
MPLSKTKKTRQPIAISLFTGAGGLDYGFEAAGFRTAVAVEMNGAAIATLKHNREWPVICRDIAKVPTEEILSVANLEASEADVLIGGPPCQPFSKSGFWFNGTTQRLNDPRAQTLQEYMRVLAEARPRAFLLENVEGFGFQGKSEALAFINRKLASINKENRTSYRASLAILNAADYGVPQIRRRMFIVGARDGRIFEFPKPTHSSKKIDGRCRYTTVWEALSKLEKQASRELAVQGKWAELLPSIPEGHNYLFHTDRGEGIPLFGWRRRYWSFLLKLAKNKPSWTLQAQPGPATGPFHWKNRKLSVREMCRIQTFPASVDVIGSYAEAQKQIGNAVPSLMAEILAREIAMQFLDRKIIGSPKLIIRHASKRIPPPERISKVPAQYRRLKGRYSAHPGTGLGHSATTRLNFEIQ